jgi:hypothetical protein
MRMCAPHLHEEVEAVRARQRQIEQDERAIGMARQCRQCLVAIDGAQHLERAVQLRQRVRKRLLDEGVIVDDEYFHGAPL